MKLQNTIRILTPALLDINITLALEFYDPLLEQIDRHQHEWNGRRGEFRGV